MQTNHEPIPTLRPPETWIDRAKVEAEELSARLAKLDDFLSSVGWKVLHAADYGDLRSQRFYMRGYLESLQSRIRRGNV